MLGFESNTCDGLCFADICRDKTIPQIGVTANAGATSNDGTALARTGNTHLVAIFGNRSAR